MQDAALTIGKFEGPISQSDNRDDLLFAHDVAGARSEGYYESSKRLLDPISMAQKLKDSLEVQKAIRRRAAELYWRSGALVGHDLDNWRQAEAEILRETGAHLPRPAVVINLEGVVYTGEYDLAAADGYLPGEWKPGDRIPIRLEGEKLFLRRPNGRELETSIIKRIG